VASIAFMTLGSMGDMNPSLGIAQAMRERGHHVTFITTPYYKDVVAGANVEFLPVGTEQLFYDHISKMNMWDPLRFIQTSFSAALTFVEDGYNRIQELSANTRGGLDSIVIQGRCFGAHLAAEQLGLPVATILPYPVLVQSAYDPTHYPFIEPLAKAGPRLARLQYSIVNWVFERTVRKELNRFRERIGVAPVYNHTDWIWSTQRHIALWPDFLRAPQKDSYHQLRLAGFVEFDGNPHDATNTLDPAFLARKPIVFTLGTAMLYGGRFFAAAAEAMAAMPERVAYFATRYPAQLPKNLPDNVRHISFVPFVSLLPHCSAVVHHGGIGTAARALASAVPQLIVPFAFDQVDNAHLLERIGVAHRLMPKKLSADALRDSVTEVIESRRMRRACSEYAARLSAQDGSKRACVIIEDMLDEYQRPRSTQPSQRIVEASRLLQDGTPAA